MCVGVAALRRSHRPVFSCVQCSFHCLACEWVEEQERIRVRSERRPWSETLDGRDNPYFTSAPPAAAGQEADDLGESASSSTADVAGERIRAGVEAQWQIAFRQNNVSTSSDAPRVAHS